MTWLIPIDELSMEQIRAVESGTDENRLVMGAPGSGKTQILLHRAKHLRAKFNCSPQQFQIFVYTNVLKNYISSALDMLDLPSSCISTYDHWCSEYYKENISSSLPWNGKSRDFSAIRSAVYEHVLAHVDAPIFDFIMVDEGQDLDVETFEVLDTIAAHVTVCADNKQQIYEDGSEDHEIIDGLGLMKANNTLLEAFRCSPYIVDLAAELVDIPDEATALVNQARTSNEGRETPLLYVASDFEDERENLIDIVRTRSMRGENVAILLHKKKQVYGFAKGLSEAGLDVELSLNHQKKGSSDKQLDFNSDRPKLMTYHSAKGLTFDTVILPRLDAGSFNNLTDERVQKLLFVGVTRATQWVYMSGTSGKLVDAVEDMIGLSEKGKITFRKYGEVPIKPAPGSTVDIGDDLDDLL